MNSRCITFSQNPLVSQGTQKAIFNFPRIKGEKFSDYWSSGDKKEKNRLCESTIPRKLGKNRQQDCRSNSRGLIDGITFPYFFVLQAMSGYWHRYLSQTKIAAQMVRKSIKWDLKNRELVLKNMGVEQTMEVWNFISFGRWQFEHWGGCCGTLVRTLAREE